MREFRFQVLPGNAELQQQKNWRTDEKEAALFYLPRTSQKLS